VPRRISRIIKRARSSARERGLPVERLLPVLEVVVGLLIGLVLGVLAWLLFRSAFVEYRYTTLLSVSVEGERQKPAAETVAAYIRDPDGDFRRKWLEDAKGRGLRGRQYLWADVQDVSASPGSEETVYAVRLICAGRPGGAARGALAAARDRIRDQEPIRLEPVNYLGRMTRLARKIADGQQERARLEADRDRLQPSAEERAERVKVLARLAAADKVQARREKALEAIRSQEKPLQDSLDEFEAEQAKLSDVKVAVPAVLRALDDERRQLSDRLSDVDRADCTADHPIVKRIRAIDRRRRRTELSGLIADTGIKLDGMGKQRRKIDDDAKESSRSAGQPEKVNADYAERQRKRGELDVKIARIRTTVEDAKARKKSLKDQPKPPITVSAEGQLLSHAPSYGYVFYLGGMLVGLLGTLIVHRKVLPAFSRVEDEVDLADALGTPVLGKVPRLAMLTRH
jgi:hypothetical protein